MDASLLIIGKKALPPLMVDSDTPIIRGIDQVLLAYAEADMLDYHRQYGKAQAKFAEAEKLFADAVALEQQQDQRPTESKKPQCRRGQLGRNDRCGLCADWAMDTGRWNHGSGIYPSQLRAGL